MRPIHARNPPAQWGKDNGVATCRDRGLGELCDLVHLYGKRLSPPQGPPTVALGRKARRLGRRKK